MAQANTRTWPVWLGFGDGENNFIPILYNSEEVKVLDDVTLPNLTSQPHFDQLAYIDKHAQPSKHTDAPEVMEEFYGKITGELVAQEMPARM